MLGIVPSPAVPVLGTLNTPEDGVLLLTPASTSYSIGFAGVVLGKVTTTKVSLISSIIQLISRPPVSLITPAIIPSRIGMREKPKSPDVTHRLPQGVVSVGTPPTTGIAARKSIAAVRRLTERESSIIPAI